MKRLVLRIGVVGLLGLLSSGCSVLGGGSSPQSTFHVLYPQKGPSFRKPAMHIQLRRPSLPEYLERPQIVRRVEPGKLDVSETDRWGASLTKLVLSTLAKNLSQRLPRCEIFTEPGPISAAPDLWIELEFLRFELSAGGQAVLNAQAALHWKMAEDAILKRIELQRAPRTDSTEAMVAAMSHLLAELSEALAVSIEAGPPPPPRRADVAVER